MTLQIVEIAGQKMAMLPIDDFERLRGLAEEQADIITAERAEQRRLAGEEYVPFEMVQAMIAGESPLRVWRKHRSLSIKQLAEMAQMRPAIISGIENGKAQGKPTHWRALAKALEVNVDDILPED